ADSGQQPEYRALLLVSPSGVFHFTVSRYLLQMDSLPQPGFLLGVNYPWVNYGQDFGRSPWGHSGVSSSATRQVVAADFEHIRTTGIKLVRWFLLCDGRSGLLLSNGIPTGPDDKFLDDVSAALDLAQQSGLQICFPLMDFLWLKNPLPPGASSSSS